MKKDLKNVTVVCAIDYNLVMSKLDDMKFAYNTILDNFNVHEAMIFSETDPNIKNVEFKKSPTLGSMKGYSRFCINIIPKFINTDYYLMIQPDGFIVNPNKWDDAFLEYDYIGAPWPRCLHFSQIGYTVGNGGFTLRSKKLIEATKDLIYDENPLMEYGLNCTYVPEDFFYGVRYRLLLQSRGIKFAPIDLAAKFSIEYNAGETWRVEDAFGCHCGEPPETKPQQLERMQNLYRKNTNQ